MLLRAASLASSAAVRASFRTHTPLATMASAAAAVNVTTDGGVTKVITKEGTGEVPATGDVVSCHYTGTLVSDGSKFDSSKDRGKPFEFTLGVGQVIGAWDKGIATMKVGEEATLQCTADYGYGARGAGGVIPPNAALKFDVELLAVKKA